MATIPAIQDTQIRVGDVLSVVAKEPGVIFSEVTVTDIDRVYVMARHVVGGREAFSRDGYWNFFLVDRPKPKLPTELGTVVRVDQVRYVMCDPHDTLCWRSTEGNWVSKEFFEDKDWELVD